MKPYIKLGAVAVGLSLLGGSAARAQMTININPNASLSANAAALAAFQRAANQWSSRFSDNITVTINAGLASLPVGVIGSTGSVQLETNYTAIRNAMVADDPTNLLLAALPTSAQFSATLPGGGSLSSNLAANKANLKALGFTGLDAQFGTADGTINFSTNFGFDFDNSNGVGAGLMDFETVAAHEIGHLLGFVSAVDDVDGGSIVGITPTTLDLFRFNSASAPSNLAAFTTATRNLVPGGTKVFSTADQNLFRNAGGASIPSVQMSTGVAQGDGRQASHWKDGDLTGFTVGIMDPTLANQQVIGVGFNDFVAMDLIGYNLVAVPEPSSALLLLAPGVLLFLKRRRK